MRIEITAETPEEQKSLAEPWVRTGCLRFGVSGIGPPTEQSKTGEFGFVQGDNFGVRGDLNRLICKLEYDAGVDAAKQGMIQVHNALAKAQQDAELAKEVLGNNGRPIRLHRP